MRKLLILGIAFLIAVMVVSMMSGNEVKEKMIIVKGELDVTKKLDEQFAMFDIIEITKNESDRLGDSVVRKLEDLVNKKIALPLEEGSPIPVSLLINEEDEKGEFASKVPEKRTYYRFKGGIGQLPPGIAEGDRIDIGILYKEEQQNLINLFMSNVRVAMIENNDILVDVAQSEHYKLVLASLEGEFVLQLPGRKEVTKKCEELEIEEIGSVDCYFETDGPRKVTTEEVIFQIKNGENNLPTGFLEDEEQKPYEHEPNESDEVGEANNDEEEEEANLDVSDEAEANNDEENDEKETSNDIYNSDDTQERKNSNSLIDSFNQ